MILDKDEVHIDTPFDQYSVDSLDLVELLIAIYGEFDIEISDDDAEKFETLGDILKYLENVKD